MTEMLLPTYFGRGLIGELPKIAHRPYMVVTMPDLWPLFEDQFDRHCGHVHLVEKLDRAELDRLARTLPSTQSIIGLGGGQALDVAKYLAWSRRVPLFQAPTALSVNAAWGHRAAVREDGVVQYVGWVVPEAIYVDFDVIQAAPGLLNRSGVCDVFCYHTALADWRLSHQLGRCESRWPYDPALAAASQRVLDETLAAVDDIRAMNEHGMRVLARGLQWGGAAFANAGWNPRHIEGVDHFFFYALEWLTRKPFIHGQPVCLGILLGSALQGNDPDRIRAAVEACDVPYLPEDMGVTWDDCFAALKAMPEIVQRAGLWHTIVSERPVTDEFCEQARAWLTGSRPWASA